MDEGLLFPLFSSLVISYDLEYNFNIFNYVKNECEFKNSGHSKSEITTDTNIFNNFFEEKQYIMNHFNNFKDNILHYESIEFDMTTSWGTKINNNGYIQTHNHSNSFYSGILYLDDVDYDNGGKLQFSTVGLYPQSFSLNSPSEFTIWNSRMWYIKPKKNRLILFPSYLYHNVELYTGNLPRYSIAFNIFMTKPFGCADSYLNISINKN